MTNPKKTNRCVAECGETIIKEVKESEEHFHGYVEVCTACDKVLGYLSSPQKKDKDNTST